jgi:hypothetical protein
MDGPDGKNITIDPKCLLPGAEERKFPPSDGERTFATQIINDVLANDMSQHRIPPEIYWQDTPMSLSDTGERRRHENIGNDCIKGEEF